MALDKAALKSGIIALLAELFNSSANQTPEEAREAFADGLSNKIDAFVKTGTVKVETTGTAAAQTGTGTIS